MPLIPKALGIAEGSLAVVLVSAGVPAADAVAGALVYRFVSHWLQLPLGWAVWVSLRRRVDAHPDHTDTDATGLRPAPALAAASPDLVIDWAAAHPLTV